MVRRGGITLPSWLGTGTILRRGGIAEAHWILTIAILAGFGRAKDFITAPSFRKEAKFAAAGSNILSTTTSSVSPFLFGIRIQVAQFLRFKNRVFEIQAKTRKYDKYNTAQDFFQKGLYMLDIGQNNLVGGFYSKTLDQILASISIILSKFEDGLKGPGTFGFITQVHWGA
ncbi:hypothetical protein T459_04213 [Capsicum annuum]|uniref:Uncharacterized protein n=1 Tax=Capsicum annuum TaxID=4072 RepID=A0A2G3A4I0_CAPAN|nr:hypothetical protein T459_04213 [Capsicum annuum]